MWTALTSGVRRQLASLCPPQPASLRRPWSWGISCRGFMSADERSRFALTVAEKVARADAEFERTLEEFSESIDPRFVVPIPTLRVALTHHGTFNGTTPNNGALSELGDQLIVLFSTECLVEEMPRESLELIEAASSLSMSRASRVASARAFLIGKGDEEGEWGSLARNGNLEVNRRLRELVRWDGNQWCWHALPEVEQDKMPLPDIPGKVLADVWSALVGAVYSERGEATARDFYGAFVCNVPDALVPGLEDEMES